MIVSFDGKRKAAIDFGVGGMKIRVSQRTTRQHGFLGIVKGDAAKLFPVADQMVFDNNLMNGEFPLSAKIFMSYNVEEG